MRRPESSPGTSSPTIAAARSVAMRGSPPYLRAWTASRAPPSSHTADRARPNAAGHSAHSRQPPNSGSGCPQRGHHGARTGRQRWRHTSHTSRAESRNERRARHNRHSAGRRSCSTASRTKRAAHGGTHHLERRRLIREEAAERRRTLVHQHLATVLRPHARCGQRAHPTRAAGSVHEVEGGMQDRKSTRLNSSHVAISYAVFCLKKKKTQKQQLTSDE